MKGLVVLLPALLLLGCCGYFCTDYAAPQLWYHEQCTAKGGHIQSDMDGLTFCSGPPHCADEGGGWIEIAEPTPISCPADAKICPDGTAVGRVPPDCNFAPCPSPTPNDAIREQNCISSGGEWFDGYCDCGREKILNGTTHECERCPEGQMVGRGLGPAFCYTPTGKQGMPCDRATDCGGGECFLVNASASVGKGECNDLPFGCAVRIDENGEFDPEMVLCVD